MARYAIIDTASSLVVNVVEYLAAPSDPPPGFKTGYIAVETATASPGDEWNGSAIVPQTHAMPPAPYVPPTPREWLERLTQAKQDAIAAAGTGNASILLWLLKAAGSQSIDVTLQETKDGVAALVTAGVITADDEATLLAP